MTRQALHIFFAAFSGALSVYVFALAANYQKAPSQFHMPSFNDVIAKIIIVTFYTIIHLLVAVLSANKKQASNEDVTKQVAIAFLANMVLELVQAVVSGH